MNYLGIDIGGTKIKMVVISEDGTILEQNEVLTEDGSDEAELWKKKIIAVIEDTWAKYGGSKPNTMKCAIAAPGLVDAENRMTLHMPERLAGIENFNWSVALKREIKAINDGHAACLAEYETFYRQEGIKQMLMLTLGTGVGGGIIINGNLYQGNLQRAGHVGHMTLDYKGAPTMTNIPGSLEYAMGNFSVRERTERTFDSVQALVQAHRDGNVKATTWWLESVEKLAVALASLTNILAPELIVLGGGITNGARELLMNPLKKYMEKYEWRPGQNSVRIKQAKHGSYAGAIGAAFFARSNQKIL